MRSDCTPTREESRGLASTHALIPLYREVLADMLTPARAYSLPCPPHTPGFLLETVDDGQRPARHSFIRYKPARLALRAGDPLPALRGVRRESTLPGLSR